MEQPMEPNGAVDTNWGEEEPEKPAVEREVPIPFYKKNPITSVFSAILIIIYLVTSASNHFQELANWAIYYGSFYGPDVQAGEWWRFITATLLHENPMHLFSNVFGILAFGGMIEPVIGSRRLLLLYLFSFVSGLFLSWIMNPQAITIGASTIDYGLIGAYLTLALLLRFRSNRKLFFQELRGALIFILIFSLWNTMESEHINFWAHVGGLISGVLFALLTWQRVVAKIAKEKEHRNRIREQMGDFFCRLFPKP